MGTTAIACHRLGRNYLGFEIIEEYVNMATKRIEADQYQERLDI